MSSPSPSERPRLAWNERPQRWLSALASVLVHAALVALLLWSSRPVVSPPQGMASGSRVRVDFVGEPAPPAPALPPPATPRQRPRIPLPPSPPRQVVDEDRLLVPDEPEQAPAPPREQVLAPPAPQTAATPPAPASEAVRRPETWTGRPPGFIEEEVAPLGNTLQRGAARTGHQGQDLQPGQASMDVGGYHVVYDLLGEARLRGWIEAGMKEVFLPLPGTIYRMVCPAEVALKRESSKCRLLAPDDPELARIGDAREVVTVMAVYHKGERVWRGPGAYR